MSDANITGDQWKSLCQRREGTFVERYSLNEVGEMIRLATQAHAVLRNLGKLNEKFYNFSHHAAGYYD